MKLKLNPTVRCASALGLLSAMALAVNPNPSTFLHLALTLGWALVIYWFLTEFSSKKRSIWDTVITGQILFLLLQPVALGVGVWPALVATLIAMLIKFFLEVKGSPIVNPAAAALLLTLALTTAIGVDTYIVSWWGASFRVWYAFVPLGIWALTGIHSWRKWPTVLSFLAVYAAASYALGADLETLKFTFTDATIYFFATIMLIEPKTSPFTLKGQIAFGAVVAIAAAALTHAQVGEAWLFALILGNVSRYLARILPFTYTLTSR